MFAANIEIIHIDTPMVMLGKHIDPPMIFIYYLIADIFLYGGLLFLLNSMLASWLCNSLVGFIFGKDAIVDPNDEKEEDKFVLAEKEYLKYIFNRAQREDEIWSL